jgi:mono/diheme cytochrome c family protein
MSTALMGVVFVVVGLAAMFLMYHLWGYPFDKATHTSAAPRWLMWTHRLLGYVFALIYIALMWKMVPRLWEYQVEFPARTTAHIILGFTIGFLLLIKIAIMRFFRHFEEWMPVLGTAIMLSTIILIGLSLPYVLQERALAQSAPGGSVTSPQSLARVATLLPGAGLPKEADVPKLASAKALTSGRHVLLDNCVKCHDLKTILAKPRTPAGWWSTVERMSEKPALFAPMTEQEMFEVTAYLVAITPDLQKATKQKREEEIARDEAMDEAMQEEVAAAQPAPPAPATPAPAPPAPTAAKPSVDMAKAKRVYEDVCAQCHDLSDVDAAPPKTAAQSRAMITRMIKENDAEISKEQIKLIAAWLDAHFVNKTH